MGREETDEFHRVAIGIYMSSKYLYNADVLASKHFSMLALELLGADIQVGVVDALVEDCKPDEVSHMILFL